MDGKCYGINGYSYRVIYQIIAINVALETSYLLELVVVQVNVFALSLSLSLSLSLDLIKFKIDN